MRTTVEVQERWTTLCRGPGALREICGGHNDDSKYSNRLLISVLDVPAFRNLWEGTIQEMRWNLLSLGCVQTEKRSVR
jgi:hypothetical protein